MNDTLNRGALMTPVSAAKDWFQQTLIHVEMCQLQGCVMCSRFSSLIDKWELDKGGGK